MSSGIALACGEVPWERELLEAIECGMPSAAVRRYVDVDSISRDAKARSLAPVLVISPALRGFAAKQLQYIASATLLVVILDTIRPPWLAAMNLDCRELSTLHFPALLEELQGLARGSEAVLSEENAGQLTVFAGASGGVGVSSLTWLHAISDPSALIVDAHVRAPLLGFLAGADAPSASLLDAIETLTDDPKAPLRKHQVNGRVLTLPLAGAPELGEREAVMLAEAAAAQFSRTIVDAGCVQEGGFGAALIGRAQQLILVATAAPSGVLRLPESLAKVRRDDLAVRIVINRLRDSAVGSRQARSAIRGLVERACGICPTFVDDDPEGFDRAWLSSDWTRLSKRLPALS